MWIFYVKKRENILDLIWNTAEINSHFCKYYKRPVTTMIQTFVNW